VRKELLKEWTQPGHRSFSLDQGKKTVLVIGGSQGAYSIKLVFETLLPLLKENKVQMALATGRNFAQRAEEACQKIGYQDVKVVDFIQRMIWHMQLADLVISRAGAIAIAELAAVQKAVVFIRFQPLPRITR